MEEKPAQRAARRDRAGAAPNDDLTVAVLVSRVKEGDPDAWSGLVNRYAPLIWAICRKYRLSPADAEDVGQTVWLRLVRELDGIRDPAALPGWLATTTRRECIRVLRAERGPHAPVSASDAGNLPDEQELLAAERELSTAERELLAAERKLSTAEWELSAAERELLAAERHAALREAVSDLPPASQQLIALLSADPPVPLAEISARLGIPIGSIGPQRARALDRLRRHPAVRDLLESEGLLESVGQVRGGTRPGSATGTSGSAGGGRDFRRAGEEGTGGPLGTPGGRLPPHPPGGGPDYGGGGHGPRPRYLRGQCPEIVPVGNPFSLLASIVVIPGPISVRTKPFDVPPGGRDVLLVAYAPDLRLLSDQRQCVHVPADTDSEPVMFELRADSPGPRSVSLTAWLGGTYLGELVIEITAERDAPPGPDREVHAEMATEAAPDGAVSLVVRYDKIQNAYRFEFRDTDYPVEVTSNLTYDPGPLVERLIAGLDSLAKGRSGYDSDQARDYLREQGADLWRELVPEPLREQFWARQHRIRQLTILADKDAVPWELLYPLDPGFDAGFLVNQFPVTRAVFGQALPRKLSLRPARFVLPDALPEAQHEIETMRRLLDPNQPPGMVLSGLTPLKELIRSGDFGLLHFACHNRFHPTDGSSITLDNALFTPTLLTTTAIGRVLARSAPTVFINACRSAGTSATYNRLDGWASKFLEAGAAAFIGSLWAVSDGAAREFAQELYRQLQAGIPLGNAVMEARQLAASHPDDPTWLAYAVYGDPRATVSQRP